MGDGELYRDCLTHAAAHFERWETWRASGAEQLRAAGSPDCIATTEYDEWPRGRIVCEKVVQRFVLYADLR